MCQVPKESKVQSKSPRQLVCRGLGLFKKTLESEGTDRGGPTAVDDLNIGGDIAGGGIRS